MAADILQLHGGDWVALSHPKDEVLHYRGTLLATPGTGTPQA